MYKVYSAITDTGEEYIKPQFRFLSDVISIAEFFIT